MITDVGYDLNSFASISTFQLSPTTSKRRALLKDDTQKNDFYQLTFAGVDDNENDDSELNSKVFFNLFLLIGFF